MSTTETTAQVSGETCRPWVGGADGVWVIGVDEAVILAGPDDEPDDRDDESLRHAIEEAGVEHENDVAAVIRCHRESIWGVHHEAYSA